MCSQYFGKSGHGPSTQKRTWLTRNSGSRGPFQSAHCLELRHSRKKKLSESISSTSELFHMFHCQFMNVRLSGSFYLTNVAELNLEKCNEKFGRTFKALEFWLVLTILISTSYQVNPGQHLFHATSFPWFHSSDCPQEPLALPLCSPTRRTASPSPGERTVESRQRWGPKVWPEFVEEGPHDIISLSMHWLSDWIHTYDIF